MVRIRGGCLTPPDSGSHEWCAHRSASAFIFIRHTSTSTIPSLSGNLCFFLSIGTFPGVSWNFPLDSCDGPVSPLEDSYEDAGRKLGLEATNKEYTASLFLELIKMVSIKAV